MAEAVKKEKKQKENTAKSTEQIVDIVKAEAKYVRVAPRKIDRVLRLIRGKKAGEATTILKFLPHSGAAVAAKVLKSAIANATNNNGWDAEGLVVTKAVANNGIILKRYRAGGKGRAQKIMKYSSHVVIELKKGDN